MSISKIAAGWTLEQKVGFLVVATNVAYGFTHAERIKAQRRQVMAVENLSSKEPIQKVPTASNKFQDHPLVAYLLQNFGPWFNAVLAEKVFANLMGEGETYSGVFGRLLVKNLIIEEFGIFYYRWVTDYVYAHIPAFSDKWKAQDVWSDFVSTNFPLTLIISVLETSAYLNEGVPIGNKRFRPLLFMAKLLFMRVFTDLGFWIGHYLIHLRSLYFIHKKHHEHFVVKVTTNYHFSLADLAIEAVIPYLLSYVLMINFAPKLFKTSNFERIVLGSYILQLEIASHAGKAIPVMSVFPPLSMFITKWDDWNPWFHAVHHKLLLCNYSITPYWDYIFGTDRY